MKRSIDIIISLVVIFLGFPLILTVLVLDFTIMTLTSILSGSLPDKHFLINNSPLFLQSRAVSSNSKEIKIYKIRTIVESGMFTEKHAKSSQILNHEEHIRYVPLFCKWLRKSGIDEIIQVLNVLKGEMSLVGPRPLVLNELKLIKQREPELYKRRETINSLPGITGLWQIYGDREKGINNLIELDEYYEKNKSFLLDMKIIFNTIIVMITASHSDAVIRKPKIYKTAKA